MTLVLSLFPGIGLLDRAFEAEGYAVVRGPDLLWGGDIRSFSPPAGKFDGIIGGPPCQRFSRLSNLVRAVYGEDKLAADLIPEFSRCVIDAAPTWFLMENVPDAPSPVTPGYLQRQYVVNNRHVPEEPGSAIGPEQNRVRRFHFGSPEGLKLDIEWAILENPKTCPTVCASGVVWEGREGRNGPKSVSNAAYFHAAKVAQGLPEDFDLPPFTVKSKIKAVGNGVPIPMGRAIARAIRQTTDRRDAA